MHTMGIIYMHTYIHILDNWTTYGLAVLWSHVLCSGAGGVFAWSTCDSPLADTVDGHLSRRNDSIMVLYLNSMSNPILSMPYYLKMKEVRQLIFLPYMCF